MASGKGMTAEDRQTLAAELADWAGRAGCLRGAALLRAPDGTIHALPIGSGDPHGGWPIYSLSKAITGAAIFRLIGAGLLDLHMPLEQALARFFARHGKPDDTRIADLTIAQLLTHRAGFAGTVERGDAATGEALNAHLRETPPDRAPGPELLRAVLRQPLAYAPGSEFRYGNTAYLVLGAVIEEASGQTYEAFCREHVLAPWGIAGALDPDWAVLWSFGGWRMAGADHLALIEAIVRQFPDLLARPDWTSGANAQSWYACGLYVGERLGGPDVSHWGTWHWEMDDARGGPLSAGGHATVRRRADGLSWFTAAECLPVLALQAELDGILARAAERLHPISNPSGIV